MHLQLGIHPAVVISSAEMAEQFLKIHDIDCSNRPCSTLFQKLSYGCNDMTFSPHGERWRQLRKISTQELLSVKKISSFQTLLDEEIDRLVSSIAELAAASAPVNFTEVLISFTTGVVTRMAFGRSYSHEDGRRHEMLLDFQSITGSFFVADFLPQFGWVDAVRGLRAEVDRFFTKLDDFYEQVIGEHLDAVSRKSEHRAEDILDTLLHMLQDPTMKITMNNVKGLLMNIYLGGTETTSAVVEWAMTELIRNPEIMKKAQVEVRRIVGRKGKIEMEDTQHLHYLKMILKETLRLHPPGPLILDREVIGGFEVDGYEIQPKTRIIVNAWAISRDAAYWERPEFFFPERFMDSAIDMNGHDFQLIPFGAGRRICPGINMATTVIEIALANLLYAFNWDFLLGKGEEDIDLDESFGTVMRKKNPLVLRATRYAPMLE